ncbi:MAG: hypothetical protein JF588_06720 [Caulobacterales bacterium]|nr:hypothetical protein [Caulobacterales bacterium]
MPRPKSPSFIRGFGIVAAAATAALACAAAASAEPAPSATATARASIVDAAELKGVAQVAPTRPGLAQPRLQVTIRSEPIPGDAAARRELIVVFD